jgi:hypothetical protein
LYKTSQYSYKFRFLNIIYIWISIRAAVWDALVWEQHPQMKDSVPVGPYCSVGAAACVARRWRCSGEALKHSAPHIAGEWIYCIAV